MEKQVRRIEIEHPLGSDSFWLKWPLQPYTIAFWIPKTSAFGLIIQVDFSSLLLKGTLFIRQFRYSWTALHIDNDKGLV